MQQQIVRSNLNREVMLLNKNALTTRNCTLSDVDIVYDIYKQAPSYCQAIGEAPHHTMDVRGELLTIQHNPNHYRKLIFSTNLVQTKAIGQAPQQALGFLDYKVNFPKAKEVIVNLLLFSKEFQRQGFGKSVIQDLEKDLKTQGFEKISVVIYGERAQAKTVSDICGVKTKDDSVRNTEGVINFWKSLGYEHNPELGKSTSHLLLWYTKPLQNLSC